MITHHPPPPPPTRNHLPNPAIDQPSTSARILPKKSNNLFSRLTHITINSHRSSPSSVEDRLDLGLIDQTIGWYCRSDHHLQNWSHLFEFSDRLSRSEPECKQTVKAIKRNLKLTSNPDHQIRATRLTVIFVLNSSDRFRLLIVKKLLPVIEDVYHKALKNPRAYEVSQTILKGLGVLGYEFRNDDDLSAFTNAYNKLKPADAPLNGIPLVQFDGLFSPASVNTPPAPAQSHQPPQSHQSFTLDPSVSHHQANIPTMRDVRSEAEIARNNARVLIGALAFTSPAEMESNEIIREFHTKCLESQAQLLDDIPWATERVSQAKANLTSLAQQPIKPQVPTRLPRTDPYAELTNLSTSREEQLLELLISVNCELRDAFHQYDQLERLARDEKQIRLVEERSKVETRFDPSPHGFLYPQGSDFPQASGSSSNPSPRPSFEPGSSTPSSFIHDHSSSYGLGSTRLTNEPEKLPGGSSTRPISKASTQGYHLSEDGEDAEYYISSTSKPRPTSQHNQSRIGGTSPDHHELSAKVKQVKGDDDSEKIIIPAEPSEKALGKMRRISTRLDSSSTIDNLRPQLSINHHSHLD